MSIYRELNVRLRNEIQNKENQSPLRPCVIDHKTLRIRNPPYTDQALTLYRVLSSAISRLFLAAIPSGMQGKLTTKAFQSSKLKPREEGSLPRSRSALQEEERSSTRASGVPPPNATTF